MPFFVASSVSNQIVFYFILFYCYYYYSYYYAHGYHLQSHAFINLLDCFHAWGEVALQLLFNSLMLMTNCSSVWLHRSLSAHLRRELGVHATKFEGIPHNKTETHIVHPHRKPNQRLHDRQHVKHTQ